VGAPASNQPGPFAQHQDRSAASHWPGGGHKSTIPCGPSRQLVEVALAGCPRWRDPKRPGALIHHQHRGIADGDPGPPTAAARSRRKIAAALRSSVARPCGSRPQQASRPGRAKAPAVAWSSMAASKAQVVAHFAAENRKCPAEPHKASGAGGKIATGDAMPFEQGIRPCCGSYRRQSRRITVVLPAPLGPTKASCSLRRDLETQRSLMRKRAKGKGGNRIIGAVGKRDVVEITSPALERPGRMDGSKACAGTSPGR